jgi:FHA domain
VRSRTRERPAFRPTGEARGGITLEVLDGPMDGTIVGGDFERIRIGRVSGNDLELHGDRSVSGDHAVLSRTEDPRVWRLEDPRSTNGTWVDDADVRLTGAQMLPADACFMVGHTVIRCIPGVTETFSLDADRLRSETERLVGLFSQGVAKGYGAAVALAAAEHRSFLTDRHLFLGLATTNPHLPVFARGRGPISARFLAETLRRNEYWTGPRGWIDRRLRTAVLDAVVVFEDDLTFTPRLLRLLQAAEEAARRAGSDVLRPADVVHAFLAGPENRPRELLVREGVDPAPLIALLGLPPAGERPDSTRVLGGRSGASPAPAAPAPAAVFVPPPAPSSQVAPLPTSGDPVLDARARDTARRLYGVASLYHLAEADDRHQALRQTLVQEVAQLPSESRPRLLGHLQRLFPVPTSSAADALEQTRSERRATDGARIRVERIEPEKTPPPPAASAIPWPTILAGKLDADLSAVAPADRQTVALLVDVVAFATDLEQFILSVVQSLRAPGLATQSFQLPGYQTSIRRFARDLQNGKAPSREMLQEYLAAIRTWLIAAVGAYNKAPEVWFKDFWGKVSPLAIERAPDQKGGFLKIDALGFWNRYKERVRTYSPDLVSDEIQQVVRQEADEKFHQLFDKRRKS